MILHARMLPATRRMQQLKDQGNGSKFAGALSSGLKAFEHAHHCEVQAQACRQRVEMR